jgi:hypothetical protein
MDYDLFQYCKEKGISEFYATRYELSIRLSFGFIVWKVCNSVKDFLTWFVHGKRGW